MRNHAGLSIHTKRFELVAALLCVAALLIACGPPEALIKRFKKDQAEEPEIRTAQVQTGDFLVTITATGRVKPNVEVEVTSKASGEILELPFEDGDVVKKGELLVRLDPDDEKRNVAKSDARLRAASARLEKAQNELKLSRSTFETGVTSSQASLDLAMQRLVEVATRYKRQQQLHAQDLIPEQDLEIAQTEHQSAKTELTRAEAEIEDKRSLKHTIAVREQDVELARVEVVEAEIALEEVAERLAETEVVAPMDGVITVRHVEPGMVISSALSNVSGGTLLMIVADLEKLFVVAAVDETDIGGIAVGQRAIIETDAFPGETFDGEVSHIAPIGLEITSVVSFDVEIEVVGAGLEKLRPGMTADVSIIKAESGDTMWVQSEAVQTDVNVAFVESQGPLGGMKRIEVETGLTDGLRTEIRGKVKEGQELVLRDNSGNSAWARGEGANRPLKDGDNMFRDDGGRRK